MRKLDCGEKIMTFALVLTIIFTTLKLYKVIYWSWIWVVSPLCICIILLILFVIFLLKDKNNIEL